MTRHAPTLDALRLFASLGLAVGHLANSGIVPHFILDYLHAGLSSVLFFVMSGYVLVSTSSFWTLPFLALAQKRIVRLLPPHWLGFALFLPPAIFGSERLPLREIATTSMWWITGLQQLAPPDTFSLLWNFPAWPITALLIGGISLPLIRPARPRDWSHHALFACLILIVAVRLGFDVLPPLPLGFKATFARHTAVIPRLLEVFAGAFAALFIRSAPPALQKLLSRDATFLTFLAASIALLAISHALDGPVGCFVFAHGPFLPLGIVLVSSAYLNTGWLAKLCSHPSIVFGAKISIFIWMLHIPIHDLLVRCAVRLHLSSLILIGLPFFLVSMLATILAASLAYFIQSRVSSARPTPEIRAPAAT